MGPAEAKWSQVLLRLAGLATTAVRGSRAAGIQSDVPLPNGPVLQPKSSAGWLTRSFASATSGNPEAEAQAKPVQKGLSAGTAPPATDQVPLRAAQQPHRSTPNSGSLHSKTASPGSTKDARTSSATVGVDQPSAAAVPAGVDQVPPSSTGHTASAQTTPNDDSAATNPSTAGPKQSMQSVINDISDIGQLKQSPGSTSDGPISRWQRLKWWVWGTPQQYWTYEDSNKKQSSTTDADAAVSTTDNVGSSRKRQRSRWSVADIIGSAILRSGITKDEDVARWVNTGSSGTQIRL